MRSACKGTELPGQKRDWRWSKGEGEGPLKDKGTATEVRHPLPSLAQTQNVASFLGVGILRLPVMEIISPPSSIRLRSRLPPDLVGLVSNVGERAASILPSPQYAFLAVCTPVSLATSFIPRDALTISTFRQGRELATLPPTYHTSPPSLPLTLLGRVQGPHCLEGLWVGGPRAFLPSSESVGL